jgi:hypothetical protein
MLPPTKQTLVVRTAEAVGKIVSQRAKEMSVHKRQVNTSRHIDSMGYQANEDPGFFARYAGKDG